jgi:hypothetical protein
LAETAGGAAPAGAGILVVIGIEPGYEVELRWVNLTALSPRAAIRTALWRSNKGP